MNHWFSTISTLLICSPNSCFPFMTSMGYTDQMGDQFLVPFLKLSFQIEKKIKLGFLELYEHGFFLHLNTFLLHFHKF